MIYEIGYGISEPKKKSMKKLEKAIDKYNLIYFDHYFITEAGFRSWYNTFVNNKLKLSYNAVLVFKNDKLIKQANNTGCAVWGSYFVNELDDPACYVYVDSVFLGSFLNEEYLRDRHNNKYLHESSPDELVIIICWATFNGKYNKLRSASNAEYIHKSIEEQGLKAKVLYVNMDMKEDWTLQENE